MRFLLLFAVLGLLVASGFVLLIFGPTPYEAVARLAQVPYYEVVPEGPVRLALDLTPGRYAAFRLAAGALFGSSLLGALGLLRHAPYRRQWRRLGHEFRRAAAALGRTVRRLSRAERATAAALLLLLLGARLAWLLLDPLSPDEIVSYDSFVHEGAAAVTSFYPIPNNHIFYNFLAWAVAQLTGPLTPGRVQVVMRLPSLLVATAGTGLSYALLAHFRNFRVATLATALFGLTRLTIIYAAAGRGYYVQLVCLQLAFFAAVGLAAGTRYRRLAWAVFAGCAVVGLYTIPTYAGPLAALGLVLLAAAAGFGPRYRHRFWGQLLAVGTAIGSATAVLYAPVGCVSGWPRLLANRYLAPHSLATFRANGLAYLYESAGMLLGPVRPGLVLSAALVGLAPLVLARAPLPARTRWMGWTCWALLVTPVALALAQRQFVPGRVLMYTTFFLYLLAALGADEAARRGRGRWTRQTPLLLLGALLAFRLVEMGTQVPELRRSRAENLAVARAYHWLRTQPPGVAFVGAPYHELMFDHYALLAGAPRTLHARRVAGTRYDYLVWPTGAAPRPAWAAPLPYRAVYRDALVVIYKLAAPRPGAP